MNKSRRFWKCAQGAVGTALGKARENLKSILDIEIKGDK